MWDWFCCNPPNRDHEPPRHFDRRSDRNAIIDAAPRRRPNNVNTQGGFGPSQPKIPSHNVNSQGLHGIVPSNDITRSRPKVSPSNVDNQASREIGVPKNYGSTPLQPNNINSQGSNQIGPLNNFDATSSQHKISPHNDSSQSALPTNYGATQTQLKVLPYNVDNQNSGGIGPPKNHNSTLIQPKGSLYNVDNVDNATLPQAKVSPYEENVTTSNDNREDTIDNSLEIIDFHKDIDKFDPTKLGIDLCSFEYLDAIKNRAQRYENAVNNYSGTNYSMEYFRLDENLFRLIGFLDKVKMQYDKSLLEEKIRVINYIKHLQQRLDSNVNEQ